MANEVVKYNNNLNYIGFNGFTETELNIFFAICARMKDKGTTEVTFTFKQLRELTKERQHYTKVAYANLISNMYHKLIHLVYFYNRQDSFGEFNIFEGFHCDVKEELFTITMTQKFAFMFNRLSEHFTLFELQEYVNIRGIYTKHIYQHLKQFRSTGKCIFLLEDFKRLIDVPAGYQMRDITKRIINPSVEKLRKLDSFADLTYEYEYRNRKVYKITFTWTKKNIPDRLLETNTKAERLQLDLFNDTDPRKKDLQIYLGNPEEEYDPSLGPVSAYLALAKTHIAPASDSNEDDAGVWETGNESFSDFLNNIHYESFEKNSSEDVNPEDEEESYTQKLALFVKNAQNDLQEQEEQEDLEDPIE